jgi:vanillate/4-hydroxybenzoate decarboxylase subunit D
MHNFPRPATPTVECLRSKVEGVCPECGQAQLARYRVMSEDGWWQVVKCQVCLHSISRDPGPLMGAFEPLGPPQ